MRTAIRFWLHKMVSEIHVVGAPCAYSMAVDGVVLEPRSDSQGVLYMGDLCDSDHPPLGLGASSVQPLGRQALEAVARARERAHLYVVGAIDMAVLVEGRHALALLFDRRIDEDILDRVVIRFVTYSIYREERLSADGCSPLKWAGILTATPSRIACVSPASPASPASDSFSMPTLPAAKSNKQLLS